jgi:ParB-like chromosome segregation protein Spo0J
MAEKQKSYRDLIAEGTASRANAIKVRIQDIYEQPGFNLRDPDAVDENGETFEEGINRFAEYIAAGGTFPPIEIRIRSEGGVWVVDGHRRRLAVLRAMELGAPLADKNGDVWIHTIAFEGNDVDRLTRIMTSNESRKLTDLERANGYKRLAAFGLSSSDIAARVGRSRPHVEQLLILANANHDVQEMVKAGKVSATAAIDLVRKEGENAGAVLGEKVAAAGGGRVKKGDLKPAGLPRKVVDEVTDALGWFRKHGLNAEQRKVVARAEKDNAHADAVVEVTAGALAELMKAAGLVEETRKQQAAKAAEKAAKASQGELPEDGAEQDAA